MKFPGLINFWGKKLGYGYSLIFVAFGIVMSFVAKDKGFLIATAWGLFIIFLLFLMDIPWINYYIVKTDKIICVRIGWRKSFLLENIADIRKIQWNDLKEMAEQSWIKMTLARFNNREYTLSNPEKIPETLKASYNYNRLISYCTASPAIEVYKGNAKFTIRKSYYSLLTLKDGKQYIVSPKDVDAFINEVSKYMKLDNK